MQTQTIQSDKLKGVVARVEGNKLIMEVDLTQNFGRSANGTGKTNVVASSGGFAAIPGFDKTWFSLNVNTKQGM